MALEGKNQTLNDEGMYEALERSGDARSRGRAQDEVDGAGFGRLPTLDAAAKSRLQDDLLDGVHVTHHDLCECFLAAVAVAVVLVVVVVLGGSVLGLGLGLPGSCVSLFWIILSWEKRGLYFSSSIFFVFLRQMVGERPAFGFTHVGRGGLSGIHCHDLVLTVRM